MRQLAWVLFASLTMFSCGGSPKPDTHPSDDAPKHSATVATVPLAPTPTSICARVFEMKAANCELTAGYDLTLDECTADFRSSLNERGAEAREATVSLGRCVLDNASCEAAAQCVANLSETEEGFRDCGTKGIAPVAMPRAEWDTRKAVRVSRFSQATSTKEEPIEVCGIWDPDGQLDWLLSKTCDDGSRPFKSIHHAHAARIRNVGEGGRCRSIVDLYEVPCPEGTYSLFIDAYVCPQDDSD